MKHPDMKILTVTFGSIRKKIVMWIFLSKNHKCFIKFNWSELYDSSHNRVKTSICRLCSWQKCCFGGITHKSYSMKISQRNNLNQQLFFG